MKNLRASLGQLFVIILVCSPALSQADELWKGAPNPQLLSVSIMGGLGTWGGSEEFSLLGSIAYKIKHEGLLDDVNDQLYLEAQAGPSFGGGVSPISYSIHLRWDFHKDFDWSFFAIGGLAGAFELSGYGGFIYPRFGVGAFWHFLDAFSFRFDVSREFLGAGIATQF